MSASAKNSPVVSVPRVRRPMVLGNWKMNGDILSNEILLAKISTGFKALKETSGYNSDHVVGVFAPFPYLFQVQKSLSGSGVVWGAQDSSLHSKGAYTGEVSASMLADFGCGYALVGHSERRIYHGETSHVVAQKACAAINSGIIPVVCFGETLSQQEAGLTMSVIAEQLAPVLELGAAMVSKMVFAYEPVWAIGTGKTASPEQAQQVHHEVRLMMQAIGCGAVSILYGGSVKANNASELFAMPDIDGGLIGGASLDADEFLRIAQAMR